MRFKKNRPCEYTTSEDRHRELLRIDEENDASSKSKGKRSVSNQPPLPQQQHPPTQHLPSISGSGVSKAPGRAHTPLSDLSDVEGEQPLASTSKPTQLPQAQSDVGQTASTVTSAAVAPTHAPPSAAAPPPAVGSTSPPKKPAAGTAGPKASPPGWLLDAANELRASHPDDRFEIIPRPSKTNAGETEWRIRCHDCPGKIYTPGPGETLENFRIHVANRGHRANVNGRLDKEKGQGH